MGLLTKGLKMFEKKSMALTIQKAEIRLIENGYIVETYLKAVDPKQYAYENKHTYFSSFDASFKHLKKLSEALEAHNSDVKKEELKLAEEEEAKNTGSF